MLARRWSRRWTSARRRLRTPRDMWLFTRMICWGAALRLLKHLVPLRALVRLVRRTPARAVSTPTEEEQVTTLARWACGLTQWSRHGNCLERALVTYRYLSSLNADPSLVVGVRAGEGGGARGHAWVQARGRLVGEGPESIEPFTRVLAFDARGGVAADRRT